MRLTVVPEPTIEEGQYDDEEIAALANERGISGDVLADAGLDIVREPGHLREGWYAIPYPHRSGVWKYRYRNPDPGSRPKYADDPGADFHLYNPLTLGPNEDEVWFAEGEFDTLALVDQGYKAIGIPGVSTVPDEDGDGGKFHKSWLLLFEETHPIVMFDNDDPGRKAGRKLAAALNGDVFDEWDHNYTDINDWHRADPAGLGEALARFRLRVRRGRGLES